MKYPGTRPAFDTIPKGNTSAREAARRVRAFLPEAIVGGTLFGFEIRPLTPRVSLELRIAGNPCIHGLMDKPSDVSQFLWRLSPRFCRPSSRLRWFLTTLHRHRIQRAARRLNPLTATLALHAWLEEQFQDAAPAEIKEGAPTAPASGFSGEAGLVHWFAAQYGWDEDKTLDTPFSRLWQYWRASQNQAGHQVVSIPPSERLVSQWFRNMIASAAGGPPHG